MTKKKFPVVAPRLQDQHAAIMQAMERKQHLEYLCYKMLDALNRIGLEDLLQRAERNGFLGTGTTDRFYNDGCGEAEGYHVPGLLEAWRAVTNEFCKGVADANRALLGAETTHKKRK